MNGKITVLSKNTDEKPMALDVKIRKNNNALINVSF
jgi:hypothetical protein